MADAVISTVRINIEANTGNAEQKIEQLQQSLNGLGGSATTNAAKKVQGLNHSLSGIGKTLGRIAMYRALRSVIRAVTEAFSEGLKGAYQFSSGLDGESGRFARAMDSMSSASATMKAQIGSAFISLLAAIAPIVTAIINLVTMLANALSMLFAVFTGGTYLKAVGNSTKFADQYKKSAGGAAAAAKEWKNQLLGFDEINKLNDSPDTGGGGGGGGGGLDLSGMFVETDIPGIIANHLAEIELAAAGFLLGLGLILLFSGTNIPLGLGLTAAGAYMLATTAMENWEWITDTIGNTLTAIEAVAAGALLAIGLFLALSGANIPLGLGLIAAGITLGAAAVLNWEEVPTRIKTILATILTFVGAAALVIGVILLFTWAAPLIGLGLIAVGALSLGSAMTMNEEVLPEKIRGVLSTILGIISIFMIVIGVLLLFVPGSWPLAFGLIIAGGGLLGAAASNLDMNSIVSKVQSVMSAIKTAIDKVTSAFEKAIEKIQAFKSLWGWAKDNAPDITGGFGGVGFGGWAASGGMFDSGEMFIARESGPELVGTIGGRTAVANNDQIVSAVASGVFSAVSAAMGSGSRNGGGVVILEVNGREFMRACYEDGKAVANEHGVSLIRV